jgi:hypothetical protein
MHNEMQSVPIAPRTEILKCIERLLMIAERYIIAVEENNSVMVRANVPHFMSYKSESFVLTVTCDNRQNLDLFVCSNETLAGLKARISNSFSIPSYNLQIYYNEKLLNQSNDLKLLHTLNIDGMSGLNVKVSSSTYTSSSSQQTPVKNNDSTNMSSFSMLRIDPEQERALPGVLIANNSSAFDMLNRLEDFDVANIKIRVRNILKLIPTNPRLLNAFDSIIGKKKIITNLQCIENY